MAEDWAAIAQEVAGEIADIGFTVTLQRMADGPATPFDTADEMPDRQALKAVEGKAYRRLFGGTSEVMTGRTLLIGATGIAPRKDDILTVRGVEHSITAVMPLAPGGVDLLWKVELQS